MQPALRHYHWRLSPLGTQNDAPGTGWILFWRDMTQDRLKLAMLYEQERALALLAARQRQETELAQQMRTELARVRRLGQHALAALDQGDAAVGAAALARLLTAIGHSAGPAHALPPTGDNSTGGQGGGLYSRVPLVLINSTGASNTAGSGRGYYGGNAAVTKVAPCHPCPQSSNHGRRRSLCRPWFHHQREQHHHRQQHDLKRQRR